VIKKYYLHKYDSYGEFKQAIDDYKFFFAVMALSVFLGWIEPRTLVFFVGQFFTIVGRCLAPIICDEFPEK
jgi:hypothetical protein